MPYKQTIDWQHAGKLTQLPPLGLYVHIPWCVEKCPYCDFNSHRIRQGLPEEDYINALLRDLETELPYFWGRKIHTIFIGGGTPGLFQAASIDRLLQGIRARVNLIPDAEITLETNPGVFEENRYRDFAQCGINRLSIGIQSFQDSKLHILGRIHNGADAHRALEQAQQIFARVNADIIYALPQQNVAEAVADIQAAIEHGISHISAYQLTIEPNTAFAQNPPQHLPDEDVLVDIEDAVHHTLQAAHFQRYEISAFCQENQRCRHNVNYWQFGDYIGIGAGAHGKISSAQGIVRNCKIRHPQQYLRAIGEGKSAETNRQSLNAKDLPFEFMMNALRLIDGVPRTYFGERTGMALHQIHKAIETAVQQNLLDSNIQYLRPTPLGTRFLNTLLALFS